MPFVAPNEVFRKFRGGAQPVDYVFLLYSLAIVVAISLRREAIPHWWAYAAAHGAVAVGVAATAGRCGAARSGFRRFWRSWDLLVYIPALFWMTTQLVHLVNPVDQDVVLIGWDRAIGGDALLRWTMTWATPATDEIGKIVWVSYYFLPLLSGIALYRREDPRSFEEAKLVLVLGWLVSYAGYYLLPALGPLYFKEELGLTDPSGGVAIAGVLKGVVSGLEGAEARDTFPSGHVMIAVLVVFLSLRNRLWRVSAVAVPLGLGVAVSTITLRYHYFVDVLAGLALCVPIAWGAVAWYRRYDEGKIG